MAKRSSIIRIRKREGFTFAEFPEGDLLDHVRANQSFYLGSIFAVIQEWFENGQPKTREVRHDFRGWCQPLDWIMQNLFGAAPLMGEHERAQERVSNPNLTFLRKICLAVAQTRDHWETPLNASQLYEIAENVGIDVPGLKEADEDKAKRMIGMIMARVFLKSYTIQLDDFRVIREASVRDREDGRGGFIMKTYTFFRQ